jgi:uncharacterized membrane protein
MLILLLFALAPFGGQDGTVPSGLDAAEQVALLLEERCSNCHSPGSDEPKATKHWPNALDLAGTVGNGELILPGNADESNLFLAVLDGDMPPPKSDALALTEPELELLAGWINAGAKVPPPARAVEADPAATQPALLRWISHFHPLIVHFPIALLIVALLAEMLALLRGSESLRGTAKFCLILGALASVPSAGLGWLLAAGTSHPDQPLLLHRWLGVTTAVFALVSVWFTLRRPERRVWFLLVLAILVSATGHTGGELTFGANWFQPPF